MARRKKSSKVKLFCIVGILSLAVFGGWKLWDGNKDTVKKTAKKTVVKAEKVIKAVEKELKKN